jgi:hypothetical protein
MTFAPAITLTAAMTDPALFGGVFAQPSFWTWRTIGKLIDGLPLTEQREIELFEQCTGRAYNRKSRRAIRRLICLAGRRAGKDRAMSAIAIWRAALCANWREYVSPGEGAVVLLLGADKKQAAILSGYCHGLLEAPLMAREVVRRTSEVIEFANGASLEIATNDARLLRGRSSIAVLGSECCHWRTDENSSNSDSEIVGAADPSMAMCPDGGLLALGSSVYRKRGYMHAQWKKLWGVDDTDDDTLVWFAPSKVMNPRLPQQVIDAALARDPQRARSEFENIWREDVSDFLPPDVIERCTDFGVFERPPKPGIQYKAFADAAGGTGKDAFTVGISYRDRDGQAVLAALREWRPKFVPRDVVKEAAGLLRSYRVTKVVSDRYASAWAADEWTRNGIRHEPSELTKSEIYLAALPMLLSGQARLLDNERMRQQFTALERRVHAGGRQTVDDSGAASANDDLSNSASGALLLALGGKQPITFSNELLSGIASRGPAGAGGLPNRWPMAWRQGPEHFERRN